MRLLTNVLLALIVVALSIIGYDLHRLTQGFYGRVPTSAAAPMTFEERVQRNMRDQADFKAELAAGDEAEKRLRSRRR